MDDCNDGIRPFGTKLTESVKFLENFEKLKNNFEKIKEIFKNFKTMNSKYFEEVEKLCSEVNDEEMQKRFTKTYEMGLKLQSIRKKIQEINEKMRSACENLRNKEIGEEKVSKRRRFNPQLKEGGEQVQNILNLKNSLPHLLENWKAVRDLSGISKLRNEKNELVEKTKIGDLNEKMEKCSEEFPKKIKELDIKMSLFKEKENMEYKKFYEIILKLEKFMKGEKFKSVYNVNK